MHMNLIVIQEPLYDCVYNPVQTIELSSLHLLTGMESQRGQNSNIATM